MNELEQEFFLTHEAEFRDAVPAPRARTLPRHRARTRPHWRPELQPVESQHAHHGDTFLR